MPEPSIIPGGKGVTGVGGEVLGQKKAKPSGWDGGTRLPKQVKKRCQLGDASIFWGRDGAARSLKVHQF